MTHYNHLIKYKNRHRTFKFYRLEKKVHQDDFQEEELSTISFLASLPRRVLVWVTKLWKRIISSGEYLLAFSVYTKINHNYSKLHSR